MMNDILVLTKRNIKIYLRDKAAVFFSFLSIIILLALYFLFLKNAYITDELADLLAKNEIEFITNSLMISGVLVINTLTLSLGNLGNIINDFSRRKLDGFLIAPIKRYKIIVSYYLSSLFITATLTLFMWFLSAILIGIQTSIWYSFNQVMMVSLYVILFTFISTAFMIFLTTFINSVNTFGAITGVFGTIIGFISGIYMPIYVLPKFIQNITSLVPFTHMTIVLRRQLLDPKLASLETTLPQELIAIYKEIFGIQPMKIFNLNLHFWWILLITSVIAVL